MGYEPKVFGLPLTLAVELYCLIHLIICLAILPQASANPINVSGMLVSPIAQWVMGAFVCISIVSIICAGVGTLYHIESLLIWYTVNLVISLGVYIAWFVLLCIYGASCTTHHKMDGSSTYSCGLLNGGTIVLMTCLCLFFVYGCWLITKARKFVRNRYSQELLPYLAGALNGSLSAKDPESASPVSATYGAQLTSEAYVGSSGFLKAPPSMPAPILKTAAPQVVLASGAQPVPSSIYPAAQVVSSNAAPTYSEGTRPRFLNAAVPSATSPSLVL